MHEAACCFTGHRPEKLLAHEIEIKGALQKEIQIAIADVITVFISGKARGVDLWAARLVLDLKKKSADIGPICAIPYQGFEKRWSPAWQELYRNTLVRADDVNVFTHLLPMPLFRSATAGW